VLQAGHTFSDEPGIYIEGSVRGSFILNHATTADHILNFYFR
jgi:hypothetical protein